MKLLLLRKSDKLHVVYRMLIDKIYWLLKTYQGMMMCHCLNLKK